jgi:hypothetical protein
MRYMTRLGCYGFNSMGEMISELKSSGLGALELFCMGLKATGGCRREGGEGREGLRGRGVPS